MENKPQNTDFWELLRGDISEQEKALNSDNPLWRQLYETEKHLLEMASKEIVFSTPVVSREGIGIFRKGTINVIQGKTGVHKSRIAELFCALMLQNAYCKTDFIGFEKDDETVYSVGYMDTERNIDEEYPAAIQRIREKAGYLKTENIANLCANSVKIIDRKERLKALAIWIAEICKRENRPLFVILDVITDFIESFNRDSENMSLYDFLGNLCDKFKVIFLLVIHENPSSEKARGHTGTEAANKSSSVFQISFEKNGKGEDTELIKLKCIKLRGAKKPAPIYLEYSEAVNGFVSAEIGFVQETLAERKSKLDETLLKDHLESLLTGIVSQKELLPKLMEIYPCSETTLKKRLVELAEKGVEMYNNEGQKCLLKIQTEKGKPTTYHLEKTKLVLTLDNQGESE